MTDYEKYQKSVKIFSLYAQYCALFHKLYCYNKTCIKMKSVHEEDSHEKNRRHFI